MALDSLPFLLGFLPVSALLVHALRTRFGVASAQWALLALSLLYYVVEDARGLPALILSILWNWQLGWRIGAARGTPGASRVLWIGIAGNVILTSLFKYRAVNLVVLGAIERSTGLSLGEPGVMPLGLTFFSLTMIMYLVDIYEGLQQPFTLPRVATFTSFFATITAGPLLRSRKFTAALDQIGDESTADERLLSACTLMSIGLVKKVVVAGSMAFIVDTAYANTAALSVTEAWAAAFGWALQLYFDFSGYSDLACGAALLLGLSIVNNFNAPFRANNLAAFWQGWHISLTTFITTYLYTPLLRAFGKPTLRVSALATFIAMLLAGLLHGATWTFLAFYALHGAGLAVYQYWKSRKRPLPDLAGTMLTFVFTAMTMSVFRSPSLSVAGDLLGNMFMVSHGFDVAVLSAQISVADWRVIAVPCLLAPVLAFVGPTSAELAQRTLSAGRVFALSGAALALCAVYMVSGTATGFIYRAF